MTTRTTASHRSTGKKTNFFDGLFEEFRCSPGKSSIKIVLIGDGSTGKTSYFNCIANSDNPDYRFTKSYDATRGCNICQLEFTIGRYPVTIHLFDTAGQEKFGMMRDSYIMGADGIILMYDLCVGETKQSVLTKWIPDVKNILKNTGEKFRIPIAVIGNKNDKIEDSFDRPGIRSATLFGAYESHKYGPINHFYVSVKADENIMDPLNWLLTNILAYITPVDAKRVKGPPKIMMCN